MIKTTPRSPAMKSYMRRFIPTMAIYVAVVMAVSLAFDRFAFTGPFAWALAVAPALPVIGVIVIMGLYLKEEADEFPRAVMMESMLWGIGVTLTVTTLWGFVEIYTDAPKLPVFWAFPIFCMSMGLAQPLVRRRYQ